MRAALVCLLPLVLSSAAARTAPAPFPKRQVQELPPTAEAVKQHLREKYEVWHVESIKSMGPGRWVVVGWRGKPYTLAGTVTVTCAVIYGKDKGRDPRWVVVFVMDCGLGVARRPDELASNSRRSVGVPQPPLAGPLASRISCQTLFCSVAPGAFYHGGSPGVQAPR